MLYPIIDIGSNTVKISVLDSEHIFTAAPSYFKAVPLNLRAKVSENRLPEEAVDELCSLLAEYKKTASELTSQPPIAFATASLRGLANQNEIIETIFHKTALKVELISGETEAYFSFLGAKGRHAVFSGCAVDLGGGSTEILTFRKNRVLHSVSMPFGCLTLYHAYFAEGGAQYEACREHIRQTLQKFAPPPAGKTILLSGGSAKAMLKYKNTLTGKKGTTVDLYQMDEILEHFQNGPQEEKETLAHILRDRFRLIPPALCVFSEITRFYGREKVLISKNGVREGCLIYHLQKKK